MEKLVNVVKKLRDPQGGCAWDLAQTHDSLIDNLEEECFELIGALRRKDFPHIIEELGDVLMQVLLHCQIASTASVEKERFDLDIVANALSEKLIYRHPHVFPNEKGEILKIDDAANAKNQWQEQKQQKKQQKANETGTGYVSVLNQDIMDLHPMQTAHKLGEISKKYNFDWDTIAQVMYKVEEEWQELKAEIPANSEIIASNHKNIELEMGDLFFTLVQLSRHLKISPQAALYSSNEKFFKRFSYMEQLVVKDKKNLKDLSLDILEGYWNVAKRATN